MQGSLTLVGGDPGIGKSTLLLQVCHNLSTAGHKVLYISGEESKVQIKMRADRLGAFSEHMLLLCETNLDIISEVIRKSKPEVVIIDSIHFAAAGNGTGNLNLHCRPCDQGRYGGRSQSAGTYGGYRSLF